MRLQSKPSKIWAKRIPQVYFTTDLTLTVWHLCIIQLHSVTAFTGIGHKFLFLQKTDKDSNPHWYVFELPWLIDSLSKSERSCASCKSQSTSSWRAITVSRGARLLPNTVKGGANASGGFGTPLGTACLPEQNHCVIVCLQYYYIGTKCVQSVV